MIETRDLHKGFGSNQILRGVDLQIPTGSVSVLLGPSGTGKSVTIRHLIGLLAPDRGEVRIRGTSLASMTQAGILVLRQEIGVMFQDGALFSSMSIYDNVAFPLRQHTDLREPEVRDVVMGQLDTVGLAKAKDLLPAALSGGMKKRAGLARALVLQPPILLCDEPDSGLDPVRTALLGDLLLERHAALGGTLMIVTHNVALARLVSDHVSLLWQGRIVADGAAGAIFNSSDPFVRQFVTGDTAGPLGMD